MASAGSDHAGASARAQFLRARRAARWCRLACILSAAIATVGAVAWWEQRWLLPVAAVAGVAAWLVRPDPDPERWSRGAAGEAATARLLASLPARFIVLHDRQVAASATNIDHMVVGPTGIWVVDSKAVRARLRVRRGTVWAGDYEVGTASAGWQARRVSELLGAPVSAVVAVHGDGLRGRGKWVCDVRVVPARRLCRLLRRGRGRRRMARSEIRAVAAAADHRFPPATRSAADRRLR